MLLCVNHQNRMFSGNSLAWELLGEWFVGASCFTRAMNQPSNLSCPLSLGSHANFSGDGFKVANQQGD